MEIKRGGSPPSPWRIARGSKPPAAPEDDRDQIARRLIEGNVRLAVTSPNQDGSRAVTLGQFGRAEVHLTELHPKQTGSSIPPIWLEVLSGENGVTIDGYGCFDLDEDELAVAVDLILDVRRHHPTGSQRSCPR
jgi:hypothetical protein